MAATTATSKVSPVVIGSGRMKSTTYIATKVTGPITVSYTHLTLPTIYSV